MTKETALAKQIRFAFQRLNPRERLLVGVAGAALIATAVYWAGAMVQEKIADTDRMVIVRTRQLNELYDIVGRYRALNGRLERAQQTFAESQMTFEEVTDQLDKIVRESIGSNSYDLKRGRTVSKVGLDYEKQDFTVKVQSLNLNEVVQLLYRLEQGESPLFLGKVDLVKSSREHTFNATLEIFSIRKS